MRTMRTWLGTCVALLAASPSQGMGQSKPGTGLATSPAPVPGATQASATRPTNVIVLGTDSIRLLRSDSLAQTDLWLGYQYQKVGRRRDAESAYIRILPIVSDSVRTYVRARLETIWAQDRASEFGLTPWPVRPFLAWLSKWRWRAEAIWLVGLGALGYLRRRTSRAGRTQLRIQPFARSLPPDIGLGIEETIADFHRKTHEVSLPVGILLNSGLKLPVMSSAPAAELVELIEIVSPPSWVPTVVARLLKGADNPRFLVTGHAAGTLYGVRIVVRLSDKGRPVRSWDRTVLPKDLTGLERALACEIVFVLSE